jgi:hypothetical protein
VCTALDTEGNREEQLFFLQLLLSSDEAASTRWILVEKLMLSQDLETAVCWCLRSRRVHRPNAQLKKSDFSKLLRKFHKKTLIVTNLRPNITSINSVGTLCSVFLGRFEF